MYVVKAKNAADSRWTTIYDSSDKALCLISQPKHSSELNQSGSFDFTIYPDSDFYDSVIPMDTFISAFEGNDAEHLDETFYGRVLTCEEDFYGVKNVGCEGALSFLKDVTVGRVSTDDNDSGQEYQTSPQAFFQDQLAVYNAKVEDRKKLFYGGTSGIETSNAELFKIDDDQDIRSVLESQLIDVYGGFFKITRLQNGTHELSYVKNYGINAGTAQTIHIGQNILDKQKHTAGDGLFTFVRPVGKDGVRLNDGVYHGVTCNSSNGRSGLYPVGTTVSSFNALYARYGFIEKAKSFDDCESSDALAVACEKYVRDYGLDALDKLPMTFDVKLVDFFNANPNIKRIRLGANYILTVDSEGRETGFEGHADGTSLQAGQKGLTLTVYSINREYENPENDSIVFYNATYLTAKDYSIILSSMTDSSESGGSRGGLSGRMAARDAEEKEEFKRFETFYEQTDERFYWLATESEWDELSQSGHVTALTELTRTARYVEDSAKMELPFDDWKEQWLVAHPEDSSLTDEQLREKYNAWIEENPYAIYNTEYSDATRTERIISKTGINSLGENETITSRVEQTADSLRSEIANSSSTLYSTLEQSLSGFRSEVGDTLNGYSATISQSANSIRAEVHSAISDIYARIIEWEGGAAIEVREGNRVFKQWGDPTTTETEDLMPGDIWVKSNDTRTWAEMGVNDWNTSQIYEWADYQGDEVYVWKGGRWQLVISSKDLVVQGARLEVEQQEIWAVVDDDRNNLRAEISLTASRFYQTLTDTADGLTSTITQTASQIRTEINDASSNVFSYIIQEAARIESVVADVESGLWSGITQEASQIRSEVNDTVNGLNSVITQTASQIRSEVSDIKNNLQSSITQTASQIRSEVSDTKNDLQSSITQTASQIRSEVSNTKNNLQSSITQTASQIRSEVSNTKNNLQSSIDQNATQIALRVKKGDVATQLAVEAGNVSVKNGNLVVDGYVTAAALEAEYATLGDLDAVSGDIERLISGQLLADTIASRYYSVAQGGSITFIGGSSSGSTELTNAKLMSFITALQIVSSGNTYTLQKKTVSSTSWTDVGNFSRATTLSGAWSGGKFTVNASPQGNSLNTQIVQGAISWTENTATVPIQAIDSDNPNYQYNTGRNVTVDATARYTAGKNAMGLSLNTNNSTVNVSESSTKSLTISAQAGITYSSTTHKYTAAASAKAGNTTMASQTAVSGTEAYAAGWAAARAKVQTPSQGTNTSFTVKVPSATEGEQQTYTFTIQKGATPDPSGYASVALGQTVVGRISIGDWYTAGQEASGGEGKVTEIKFSPTTTPTFDTDNKRLVFDARLIAGHYDDEEDWVATFVDTKEGLYVDATAAYNAGRDDMKGNDISIQVDHYDASAGITYWKALLLRSDGSWEVVKYFS